MTKGYSPGPVAVALLGLSLFSSLAAVPAARGFQTSGQYASTVIGEPNFYTSMTEGASNRLYQPFRVAFDSHGDLWVVDENNNRVLQFKPPFFNGESASLVIGQANLTSTSSTPSQSTLFGPVGIAFDSSGDLWIADSATNHVLEFKLPFSNGMNASLELGQPAGPQEFAATTPSQGANGLNAPVAAAFDKEGDLWVADRENNRILEFKPPFTSGMDAASVIGQLNTTSVSNYVVTSPTGLSEPNGIAFDSQGDLWVVDETDNRVLEFPAASLGTDHPAAVLEIGQHAGDSQFYTNAAADNRTGFTNPVDIAFDNHGNLWVSDRSNNRVLEFDSPFSDAMPASTVVGTPPGPNAFDENVTGLSYTEFWNPLGIAFDPSGNLWVSDQLNDRVLEFSGAALSTAATHVNIPLISALSQVSVSGGNSCYQTGVQNVCHVSADESSGTGVSVDLVGVASASDASVYSSVMDTREEGSLLARGPVPSPVGLYQVVVSGFVSGTASVCVDNHEVGPSTGIAYFTGTGWASSSNVSRHPGSSICGSIPLSAISSGNSLIAIGPSTAPSFLTAGGWGVLAVFFGAIMVSGYALFVRRMAREEAQEEPEEGDSW